jgi:GMP synthase-like glutamine amidotransferase
MSFFSIKPIAILEYDLDNGPAYFADYLRGEKIPFEHIRIDHGEAVPKSITPFAGLCLMGGSPSVNDDLPWIGEVLTLTREAIAKDIPVIGHCFGGQLLSKALGGVVTASPEPEIGWGNCEVEHSELAHAWFGKVREFPAFQWHFESFSIPKNAIRILKGKNCVNQAFVLGPHIGLQPHIEVDETVIRLWANKDRAMLKTLSSPGAQSYSKMIVETKDKLSPMRAVTQQVYGVWLGNVLEREMALNLPAVLAK